MNPEGTGWNKAALPLAERTRKSCCCCCHLTSDAGASWESTSGNMAPKLELPSTAAIVWLVFLSLVPPAEAYDAGDALALLLGTIVAVVGCCAFLGWYARRRNDLLWGGLSWSRCLSCPVIIHRINTSLCDLMWTFWHKACVEAEADEKCALLGWMRNRNHVDSYAEGGEKTRKSRSCYCVALLRPKHCCLLYEKDCCSYCINLMMLALHSVHIFQCLGWSDHCDFLMCSCLQCATHCSSTIWQVWWHEKIRCDVEVFDSSSEMNKLINWCSHILVCMIFDLSAEFPHFFHLESVLYGLEVDDLKVRLDSQTYSLIFIVKVFTTLHFPL